MHQDVSTLVHYLPFGEFRSACGIVGAVRVTTHHKNVTCSICMEALLEGKPKWLQLSRPTGAPVEEGDEFSPGKV
jgi:hypothetical protein